MPSLHWIGKEQVVNHHHAVPFHILEKQYDFNNGSQVPPAKGANKIIHGDNLEALKSLLPEYEGKIKCIYIDPPYNTGNENWVYNDNVNHPKIKKWLGEVVGKEGEDLSRHDKWLCMMYPRLKLLHKLLKEDGVIFISIDDNEQANLKLIMDEIFGSRNFVSLITAQTNPRGRTLDKYIAKTNEFVLVFTKTDSDNAIFQVPKDEEAEADYKNQDELGKYRFLELRNRNPVFNRQNRPNLYYPLYVEEKTGNVSMERDEKYNIEVFPLNSKNEEGCWTWGKEKVIKNNKLLVGKKVSTGAWRIHRKDYFEGTSLLTKSKSVWLDTNINHENGKELLGNLFGKVPFDFPKSVHLVEKCLLIGTKVDSNDIVLDCFAGSGTTAHAVINLNRQDGGNRKFILIEMEDYAETITAERVKRVMKYPPAPLTGGVSELLSPQSFDSGNLQNMPLAPSVKRAGEVQDESFSFYELGERIFDDSQNLNEKIGIDKIREYVYFTDTRERIDENINKDNPYYMGRHNNTGYYFYYEKDQITDLDYKFLATMSIKADSYIIYADICTLSQDFMREHYIIFKKIPRDIAKL